MTVPAARSFQSIGRERRDPPDDGWEFLSISNGMTNNDHDIKNKDRATVWSSGVFPGNANGNEHAIRKNGAHANGLSKPHAMGLNLCLCHPLRVDSASPHSEGIGSSPFLIEGGRAPPSMPHHDGFPSNQNLSPGSSIDLGSGTWHYRLRRPDSLFTGVPQYKIPCCLDLVDPPDISSVWSSGDYRWIF